MLASVAQRISACIVRSFKPRLLRTSQLQPFASLPKTIPLHQKTQQTKKKSMSTHAKQSKLNLPHFQLFKKLMTYCSTHGQGFPVKASNIQILNDPTTFHSELKSRISTAQHRIIMSSLYIGPEPKAYELLEVFDVALSSNPSLKVIILLDCLRGTRNTANDKTDQALMPPAGSPFEGVLSSLSILFPLEVKYPDRFNVHYYHTSLLSGILKWVVPERYNELIGVQHIKCYLFDDDVMISGANLSQQYFDNRQDRYMWFKNSPLLSEFYSGLIHTICNFSYYADKSDGILQFPILGSDPYERPKSFQMDLEQKLKDQTKFDEDGLPAVSSHPDERTHYLMSSSDTWVFPTIQLGYANVNHDFEVSKQFLQEPNTSGHAMTWLTSPYFNIAEAYNSSIMSSQRRFDIIVASPTANGFYNGSGLSGMVPWAYDVVLKNWFTRLGGHQIQCYEYSRSDWTFHAKGIWLEGSASPKTEADWAASLVGSSNFGIRSVHRDLESQVALFTTNQDLIAQLRKERLNIFDKAPQITSETFQTRDHNHSLLVNMCIPIATKFM